MITSSITTGKNAFYKNIGERIEKIALVESNTLVMYQEYLTLKDVLDITNHFKKYNKIEKIQIRGVY